MGEDITRGLPADLASVLRDQSIVVPQDAPVFDMVAAWAKAPSATAGADIMVGSDLGLLDALYRQTTGAQSTTGVGC